MLSPVPAASTRPSNSPADCEGPSTLRQPHRVAQNLGHQVRQVLPCRRVEVTGPTGVATVGGGLACAPKPPGQPIVGEHHIRDALGTFGMLASQPGQLGDSERSHRHRARVLGPPSRAVTCHQRLGVVGRTGVVPQQRVEDRLACRVQRHHPVLLGTDRHRVHTVKPASGYQRLLQRVPPATNRDGGSVGMTGAATADLLAGRRIPDGDLDRLRGRVDPGDQAHPRKPRRCSMANWLMLTNG